MDENLRALRVLVVEDELLIRWSIAETLAHAGHTVIEAADGASAITALKSDAERIDAVVLDYRSDRGSSALSRHAAAGPKIGGGADPALLEAHGERVVRVTWDQAIRHRRQTLARLIRAGAPKLHCP